jgi:TPP-dependent pyruvate/acetoin dehydrogenase alpha subunit
MERVRQFEECIAADFRDGRIPGVVHLSIGQEAVSAGVSLNLERGDYIATTHRGHGHMLAKGVPMKELMAEIWGKATGVCGGRGGSMHIAHRESGGLGANSVVGGGQPFAAGAAMAIRSRGGSEIVVSYFGDGAVSSGGFHEGVVMATVFSLPILYVGENNGYAETTNARFHLREGTIGDRMSGYGLRWTRVDGMDAEAVDGAVAELVSWIRSNGKPALLECETYRYRGHFEGDPGTYRTNDELEKWRARDPLERARRRLREAGATETELQSLSARVRAEVDDARRFAEESPLPSAGAVTEGVYA